LILLPFGSDLGSVPEILPELVPFVLRNLSCFTLDIGMPADGFISTGTVRHKPSVTALAVRPFSASFLLLPILIDGAFLPVGLSAVERIMIHLTRLNNHPLAVNSDLIKFVEQSPDTVLTLVNGEKIVVRESAQEVLERVVHFRRSVLQGIMLWWDNRAALPPTAEGAGSSPEEK